MKANFSDQRPRGLLMRLAKSLQVSPLILSGSCFSSTSHAADFTWHMLLSHDRTGQIEAGSKLQVINAVRNGCRLRVAWGSRRTSHPISSIEHVSEVSWISVRNQEFIKAQIGGLITNLEALGNFSENHPRLERFGGTEQVVEWWATLSTDGSFDAVWFAPHSGQFIARIPQRHPMKWYSDCRPSEAAGPLFPPEDL